MTPRLRICFVAPCAYPVLAADRSIRFVGGAEVQQSLIAPELARRGHCVSMICMDYGQQDDDFVSGVRMLKMHAPTAGIPGLRFIHPRLTSLWGALKRADADVYYQRGAGALTGFVTRFARWHGRRCVFASSSDLDFDKDLAKIRFARDRWLFRSGVSMADQIVVQSDRQVQLCKTMFDRLSVRVNSCCGYRGTSGQLDGVILWVGNMRSVKRPEIFLDLAEQLPEYKFRLVGHAPAGSEHVEEALKRRAAALGNVEMTGFVPYADVEAQFDNASLLVNTSVGEGFPNTFLQAWARGIPTVSFFDSGSKVDRVNVGQVVDDLNAMVSSVRLLKADRDQWHALGARAVEYFRRHHTVESVVDEYERVFADAGVSKKEVLA